MGNGLPSNVARTVNETPVSTSKTTGPTAVAGGTAAVTGRARINESGPMTATR